MSSISTFAASFLQTFGLRAFGGWQRNVRPGMEDGMFPCDESTAELFECDTEEDSDKDAKESATVFLSGPAVKKTAVTDPLLAEEKAVVSKERLSEIEKTIIAPHIGITVQEEPLLHDRIPEEKKKALMLKLAQLDIDRERILRELFAGSPSVSSKPDPMLGPLYHSK